jgi:hypothetical protein
MNWLKTHGVQRRDKAGKRSEDVFRRELSGNKWERHHARTQQEELCEILDNIKQECS